MERLTERSYEDGTEIVDISDSLFEGLKSHKISKAEADSRILHKLAEYEDLEEQGRLVKLPCKVGDTVYAISMGKVIILTVNEISMFYLQGRRMINAKCKNADIFRNFVGQEFGITVFLAKSEAEEKLKELRGERNEQYL